MRNARRAKSSERPVTRKDVEAWLRAQDKEALVTLLLEGMKENERLSRRLFLEVARTAKGSLNVATYRRAIDDAVDQEDFVDYHEAYDYASGIEEVVDSIADLLKKGHAAEVIELAEHGLGRVERAMESTDDSDGYLGGILERLQELHLAACRKGKPDPEALARRLFEVEIQREYGVFFGAADTYAGVLGEKGLAEYRRLAETEWAKVKPLGPGGSDAEKYGRRSTITRIMETLAKRSGDLEALVAVKSRDLSGARHYLAIAEIYGEAGQDTQALAWAEKGLKAFPERTDSSLREFLADAYCRNGRNDEAMTLLWADFADWPRLDRYQILHQYAKRAGTWPEWREKALSFLRARITDGQKKASWRPDRSPLVEIFLWEKDVDAAWAEATAGGCSEPLWMTLAAKREKKHPGDALAVYRKRVEPTIARTNNEAYKEAMKLLRKVRELMLRVGQGEEFEGYVRSLRTAHRPKRNLIKLLDEAGWGAGSSR